MIHFNIIKIQRVEKHPVAQKAVFGINTPCLCVEGLQPKASRPPSCSMLVTNNNFSRSFVRRI